VVSATDGSGDVKVYALTGPTTSQRRTIDIREVRVATGLDAVRFTVRIGSLTTSDRFDQMAFITLRRSVALTDDTVAVRVAR